MFSFCLPIPVLPVRFQRYLLFLILYITIYILISYITIIASVDPCFLIDITDIDIGLVIFSLKWKPDCIFFTIFASKYRREASEEVPV